MRHYTYIDGNAGAPVMHYAPRLRRLVPTVHYGQRLGTQTYGRPFPVHEGVLIFECDAPDITVADSLLLAATGLDAFKTYGLQCYISDAKVLQLSKPTAMPFRARHIGLGLDFARNARIMRPDGFLGPS